MVITRIDKGTMERYGALYRSQDWEARRKTIAELSAYHSPDAEDLLIAAADDTHQLVRIEALEGLEKIASAKGKRKIQYIAEYEHNLNVRWHALRVLSDFRDSSNAPIFAKGLASQDWLVREESIKGLLRIEDFTVRYISVPYILQALNDPSINVRLAALENMKVRDERLYAALSQMLAGDILGQYTMLKGVLKAIEGYRLDDSTRKRITSLLMHPNVDIRVHAFRVLKSDRARLKEKR